MIRRSEGLSSASSNTPDAKETERHDPAASGQRLCGGKTLGRDEVHGKEKESEWR
jgi:hypothetical protein